MNLCVYAEYSFLVFSMSIQFIQNHAEVLINAFFVQVAQRCLPFLHNCINELKILEISSPPGAVACWIFLCCLEVLHTCEKFNDTGQVEAYSLYTAGLWAYARDKVLFVCVHIFVRFCVI